MSKTEYTIADLEAENATLRQRAERAERILAALREQSEAVVGAAARAEVPRTWAMRAPSERARMRRSARAMLRAAVAAAEKEVDA